MKTWLIAARDADHADEIITTLCVLCPDREGVKISSFHSLPPGPVEIMVKIADGAEGAEALIGVLQARVGEAIATD